MNNRFCSFFKGYLKLNRIKKSYKNHLIFIALDGIGDICYSFCALQELKTTTNKKVLVITREYSSELLKYYECIDNIIVLNDEDGKEVQFASPMDSLDAGIGFIHQELNLINDLTIYENLFLTHLLYYYLFLLKLVCYLYEESNVFH